jgi:hypothetical protein
MNNSRIIIPSYLGPTREIGEVRLRIHIEQLNTLTKTFPGLEIFSICSGYEQSQKDLVSNFQCEFLPRPTQKYVKYRIIFDQLLKSRKLTSVLLLDDDTLPDSANEFGLDTVRTIEQWLNDPNSMPAPVIFFSGRGLLHDTYTDNRPPTIGTAPIHVAGAMIMIRSDAQISIFDSDFTHYRSKKFVSDDTVLRIKFASLGIPVAKHRGIFFKTILPPGNNRVSTVANSHRDRKRHRLETDDHIQTKWPWLFISWKGKRPLPVWELRGKKLKMLLDCGALKRNEAGIIYPVPKWLKMANSPTHSRPSLLEILA